MGVELRLLSGVRYRDREITGTRLRDLLALLAADLRAGCSAARLVDGLWPEEQPERPTKALQILVSRARAQLGADLIASKPTGYRLSLPDEQVDAAAILLHAAASAGHARAGDHAAALAGAEAGLALWDGAEGGDAAPGDPVAVLREERVPAYRSLVRARALALSRLGRPAEAAGPLAELAGAHPRDEEVLLELLRCEEATLGPAAALARYEAYRRALRDELGTDPGPALQALHQRLLRGDAPALRHGVAHEPNPLLGRDGDVAAVTGLLRTSRVVSIVGPGGLGKTRLANAVSREAEQRVVYLVPLAGVATDADVAAEVASALGTGESRGMPVGHLAVGSDAVASIAGVLGSGPALLVLDNCEHVVRGVADLVQALVSTTRDVRVLTTSRAPLGLSSESVYPLPELSLPITVELFHQRARAARPGVELPAGVVSDLCRHLDGLPLAVELAAARVRVMSVTEIARRLDDRFALLRGGARDAPERHRTLRAVVDWSWNLLDPDGQAALRALSIFPGGFGADAAEHMLAGGDALTVLEHLVDQSLLKAEETGSGTRFRMLETVREFGAAQREAAGEADRVTAAFLAWARDFGRAHHEVLFGSDPFVEVEWIRAEQDNLVQALRVGIDQADGATVAATIAALSNLWILESNYTRLSAVFGDAMWALSHFRPQADLVEVTRSAATLGTTYAFFMKGPSAVRPLAVLRRLPPAPSMTFVAALATVLSSPATEVELLASGDEPLVAGVANGVLSYFREFQGEPDAALKAAEGMVEAFADGRVPVMQFLAHCRVSELCLQVARGEEARRHLNLALAMLERLGTRSEAIWSGARWGMVLANLQTGDVEAAERWLDSGAPGEGDDSVTTVTFGLGVRAEIQLARGEIEAGLRLWRRAAELMRGVEPRNLGIEPGLEPWLLEVESITVVAHARHGRLDLVPDIVDDLPGKLGAILAPPCDRPAYLLGFPVSGALLLALAMVDLARGATESGVRLVALAERFRFLRSFQPTMSVAHAREAAQHADGPAYEEAVSSYAGLDHDGLRAAAAVVLHSRA